MDDFEAVLAGLKQELVSRGEEVNDVSLWGWLKACWPTDSDAGELAEDYLDQRLDAEYEERLRG